METNTLSAIRQQLEQLESNMLAESGKRILGLPNLHAEQIPAAKNLIHYMILRNQDLRNLQDLLHINGLSSLASSESHVHRQLQAIMERLGKHYEPHELSSCTYEASHRWIETKSCHLFGSEQKCEVPAIMVTFDTSFANNYALIKNLLQNGMNVARINCAHDDETTWAKMINKLKKACYHTKLDCKIYMDLAGPKLRTLLLNKGKEKGKVKVEEGQMIWLAYHNNSFEKDDVVISPGEPGILETLQKGERVYIDDGVIRTQVEKVKKDRIGIRITRISSEKKQIKADKGINFPDSQLNMPPLTEFDRRCLPFICEHAHLVGYSFVKTAADVAYLRTLLNAQTSQPPNIIIKIETPESVVNLPDLLLEGMQQPFFGVMIARGDLAVEIGFERMSEVQEEILWICEAAHVPVIWATQVLDNLNKSGIATRSEITDATHAALAECIMINKGEHTIEVIETLRDILHRTAAHRIKKRYTFRPLSIATKFLEA